MTLADGLKPVLAGIRAIPGQLGLRPHTVAIVNRSWSGPHTGDGTMTETTTAITESGQPPRCRWLSDEQRALAGLVKDAVDIGPLTPSWAPGSGVDLSNLDGRDLSTGQTLHVRITGPNHPSGALYRVTRVTRDKALRYMLRAEPVE